MAPEVGKRIDSKLGEQLYQDVSEAACLMLSIRNLCREGLDGHAFIVETLAQKAGWHADRCMVALGHGPVCGKWKDWCGKGAAAADSSPEAI